MILPRLLVPTVLTLVLSTVASSAGPCTQQIAQTQAQIDARLAANAVAGPNATESLSALRSRQPTPQSIAEAEVKLGDVSPELMNLIGAGMARAREADLAGDQKECEEAIGAVRHALGQ